MDIQLPQILFQIVNFFVVLGALTYLLYKPVLKIFEERARRIEEGQKAANQAIEQREKIDELKATAKKEMKQQKAAALEEATEEAEERKAQIIAEAKTAATKEVAALKKQWEEERARQMAQMQQQMVTAVVAATEKVIGKALDKKEQSSLIDKELSSILKSL